MLKIMIDDKTGKLRKTPIAVISALVVLVFAIAVFLNWKNTDELTGITETSIKSELISISLAAAEILDVEAFDSYNSKEDVAADQEAYDEVLAALRALQSSVGAEYIYALKEIGGEYYFIFDTDSETNTLFFQYEIYPVHVAAFRGERSADVLNVQDEYGSFNTGAVPIYLDGKIIGIICTDIEDTLLIESTNASIRNSVILAAALVIVLAALMWFLLYLLKKIKKMQENLHHMANNDTITGLPNRRYLFEYLDGHMAYQKDVPFALVFIDLDNFKSVNDLAGHDAGDELLRKIGHFLNDESKNAKTFHPSAGYLNVSARVGGDEFIQVYPGAATKEDAVLIAEHLFEAFKPEKISRYIEQYKVGLSIGIALYPYHSENYHAIIKYADSAMYEAKRAGKSQYRVYTEGMRSKDD